MYRNVQSKCFISIKHNQDYIIIQKEFVYEDENKVHSVE